MKEDGEGTQYTCQYKFREGEFKISLEGFEVLHLLFNSENFANGLFETLKKKDRFLALSGEQRDNVYAAVSERLTKEGFDFTSKDIRKLEAQALRTLELNLVKDSIETARKMVNDNLANFVVAFWEKLLNLATFTGSNALRDLLNLPDQKHSAKAIEAAMLRLEREKLKPLIGAPTTRGGAHNVKHVWTDEERACLAAKYEALQPIWIEAKRIATAAQKSRERTRKKGWRDEVLRAYPDLPADLLERFANPRADDAKPADIAIIHAKRECGVTNNYSPRHLRDQIRAWKLKNES